MTKYHTHNPLGSTDPRDLFDNAQNLDTAINSITAALWQDRFGRKRKTWYGLQKDAQEAIATFGYITLDSFEGGATLKLPNQVLRWKNNGEYYRWDGDFPPEGKVVQAGSTPETTGGINIGAWLSVGDATLRGNLASESGAGMVGSNDGETVQQHLDQNESDISGLKTTTTKIQSQHGNNHRYKVLFEMPLRFNAYDTVVAANGYTHLYASGHYIDHTANELWVFFAASGGDEASWFVVYDLTTLVEKTYFKAGMRWTKSFSLNYSGGARYLYSRSMTTTFLAKFDVTALPGPGSTIIELSPPRASVKYIFAGLLGNEMLVPYDAPTTNTTPYSNTFNILDKDTWTFKRSIRMDTVGPGNEYGNDAYLYKNQGTVLTPNGIAMAFGGITEATDTMTSDADLRIVQGVILKTEEGVTVTTGLFDPYKGMQLLAAAGYEANRFEHEGLFYDQVTEKLSTIWHFTDNVSGKFLIVEAFSGDVSAIDMKNAAIIPRPRIPDVIGLYRSNFDVTLPSDPNTGATISSVEELAQMQIRYDHRKYFWYSSNFTTLTFNGASIPGTAFCELFRGTNGTFKFTIRNTGVNQEWQIVLTGTTYTYTKIKMIATEYMFEGTNTGCFIGTGSPEGIVTASQGSIYHNRSGGSGTSVYFKENGSGNTGWVGK